MNIPNTYQVCHWEGQRSFSLTELLVVIAVMAMLMSVSLPALTSLAFGGHFNQAVTEVNGMLEQARQYAVAQNTYVWVAFNIDQVNSIDQLAVAVVSSKDGTDLGPPYVNPTSSSSTIRLVSKIRTFPQLLLQDTPTATNSLTSSSFFSMKIPGASGSSSLFTRGIQFTPSGEARVAGSPVDVIEFGLQPKRNSSAPTDTNNIAIVRVTGITGRVKVDRP